MGDSAALSEPQTARREAAMRFLVGRIDYERTRSMPYDPHQLGLGRMRQLLDLLGGPDRGLAIIHVAGTKGKGSTSAMIAAALSAAGLRTGLFTSPHLDRVEERMRIDGQPCTPQELAELVELVQPAVETMDRGLGIRDWGLENGGRSAVGGAQPACPPIPNPQSPISNPCSSPTFFEITTAMALAFFARQQAHAAVLEVGLGGRLDATNVCSPRLSVITSISFDHTQQLGDSLAAIAREKGGIIKPGVPVVSGVTEAEPREVIRHICRQRDCRLIERGTDFDFEYEPPRHLENADGCGLLRYRAGNERGTLGHRPGTMQRWSALAGMVAHGGGRPFALRLPGRHQAANAALAITSLEELGRTGWDVPEEAVRRALSELVWPARVEVVARRPAVVVDAAHNVASIRALLETLQESFAARRRILIFAASRDKDHRGMIARLPGSFDEILWTRYRDNPRAVPPEELQALAVELGQPRWPVYPDSAAAWEAARRLASAEDLIVAAGSFFLAAEVRRLAINPIQRTMEDRKSL
jgi:dihydrofolate synthase/folylpolyglutamate synthase